ncbi:MAG TPA: DUF4197 domain-containing protein [Chitinophagaceae bacterium]|nr:DUF4197 domain-containing protein [Chitinophagaceae bacterium]
MKKLALIFLSVFTLTFTACDTLKKLGVLAPTELEMAMGLKDALSQGLFRSFDAFADPNANAFVRFVFPGDAAKIEKTLRDVGLSKVVDEVTGKFTRATVSAVTAAKPIFLNSLKEMSIRDAVGILITDNTHAATEYFKSTMTPQLMTAFRPIVDSTIRLEGANKDWSNIVSVYNKLPFISKPLEYSLTDFIAARAIDGMFNVVANEEEQIRSKYEFRKTDLMKKVFGYAEQELAKRKQQQ